MNLDWVPTFVCDGVTLAFSYPVTRWIPGARTIGSSQRTATGVPGVTTLQRRYTLALSLRFVESEWPLVRQLIEFGQTGESFTWFPGGNASWMTDNDLPSSYDVTLGTPKVATAIKPNRDGSLIYLLTLPITLEMDEPFTLIYFPTIDPVGFITLHVADPDRNIEPDDTTQATATAFDGSDVVIDVPFTWSSSDPSIATVSSTGLITGVAEGSAVITVSAQGIEAHVIITVHYVIDHIVVTLATNPIPAGNTDQTTVVLYNVHGVVISPVGRVITYASSNAAIATVSGTGLVTAVATGTATITATSEGVNGTVDVTVAASAPVADYQWRADSGLTGTGWVATHGGMDLSFVGGAPTVSPVTGAHMVSGITAQSVAAWAADVDIGWVFVRLDGYSDVANGILFGQSGIANAEIWFSANTAARFINMTTATGTIVWESKHSTIAAFNPAYFQITFTGVARPTVFIDSGAGVIADTPLASGSYNGKYTFRSGSHLWLGRRQSGTAGVLTANIKEIQFFTATRALSAGDIAAIKADIMSRWP
jgi:hypothetical protein